MTNLIQDFDFNANFLTGDAPMPLAGRCSERILSSVLYCRERPDEFKRSTDNFPYSKFKLLSDNYESVGLIGSSGGFDTVILVRRPVYKVILVFLFFFAPLLRLTVFVWDYIKFSELSRHDLRSTPFSFFSQIRLGTAAGTGKRTKLTTPKLLFALKWLSDHTGGLIQLRENGSQPKSKLVGHIAYLFAFSDKPKPDEPFFMDNLLEGWMPFNVLLRWLLHTTLPFYFWLAGYAPLAPLMFQMGYISAAKRTANGRAS